MGVWEMDLSEENPQMMQSVGSSSERLMGSTSAMVSSKPSMSPAMKLSMASVRYMDLDRLNSSKKEAALEGMRL